MNRKLRGRGVGLAFCAVATGCRNQPGALRLELEPAAATFRSDEPLRFKATLVADAPRVCVGRHHGYEIEVRGPIGEETRPAPSAAESWRGDTERAYCGTALVPLMPILIFWPVAQVVDVGNVMGNYEVLPASAARKYSIVAWIPHADSKDRRLAAWHQDLHAPADNGAGALNHPARLPFPQPGRWKPGRYEVRVRFEHPHQLAPLFWQPYDHELSASTSVMIVEQPEDPARQAFLESVAP